MTNCVHVICGPPWEKSHKKFITFTEKHLKLFWEQFPKIFNYFHS